MTHWIQEHVLGAPAWLVYSLVGLIVFVEDAVFVGFVVPGETAAVLGGVTARLGHTHLAYVLLVVVVAAVVGDSVGYEVGKHLGPRILDHRAFARHRARLDSAQGYLRDKGGLAVFLGRWTAFFRAVMPALAGMSGMPYRRFLLWNAIGGVTWGTAVVLLGYLAGLGYERFASRFGEASAVVVVLVALVALGAWHLRRRRAEAG